MRRRSSPSGSAWSSTRTSIRRSWPGMLDGDPSMTRSAADWRPRMSPPAASAASSAPSSRAASEPASAAKAVAIASGTPGSSIMLACTVKPSPMTWPACTMHSLPVCAAARPVASTDRQLPHRRLRVSVEDDGEAPPRDHVRPAAGRASSGPWATSAVAWVATAPTPGSSHGTTAPAAEEVRLHRHPELPGVGAASDDRVRHLSSTPTRGQRGSSVCSPVSSSSVRCQPHRSRASGGPRRDPTRSARRRPRGARGRGAGRGSGRRAARRARGSRARCRAAARTACDPAASDAPATGTRTTTSSESPSAIDRIGWSSSFSSMSHTICWAASPRSSAACDRCSRPRSGAGSMRSLLARSTQSSRRSFISSRRSSSWRTSAARPWSRSTEGRVGEADGHLGDVLHLHEHVDGPVEVGQRAVLGRHRRLPERCRRQLAQTGDARRRAAQEDHVAGQADRVAVDVGDPVALAADGHHAHARLHGQLRAPPAAGGRGGCPRGCGRGATPPRRSTGRRPARGGCRGGG